MHLPDDLAAYALGILDPADAQPVERHLAGCPECRGALAEIQEAVESLAWAAPEAEPDPRLRAKVLAGLERRPGGLRARPRLRRPVRLLAVVAALLLFGLGFTTATLLMRPATTSPETTEISRVFDPAKVETVRLQPTELAPQVSARAYYVGNQRDIVLAVDALPPPPPGKVYQLWANAGGRRWSAGTFAGERSVYRFACPREMGVYDAIGVTLEPAGGQPEPTGPRVMAALLPKS